MSSILGTLNTSIQLKLFLLTLLGAFTIREPKPRKASMSKTGFLDSFKQDYILLMSKVMLVLHSPLACFMISLGKFYSRQIYLGKWLPPV